MTNESAGSLPNSCRRHGVGNPIEGFDCLRNALRPGGRRGRRRGRALTLRGAGSALRRCERALDLRGRNPDRRLAVRMPVLRRRGHAVVGGQPKYPTPRSHVFVEEREEAAQRRVESQ